MWSRLKLPVALGAFSGFVCALAWWSTEPPTNAVSAAIGFAFGAFGFVIMTLVGVMFMTPRRNRS